MSYRVRFTPAADRDLLRLYDFILEMSDGNFALAERALAAIRDGVRMIEQSPFSCRRLTSEGALLRELLILTCRLSSDEELVEDSTRGWV